MDAQNSFTRFQDKVGKNMLGYSHGLPCWVNGVFEEAFWIQRIVFLNKNTSFCREISI